MERRASFEGLAFLFWNGQEKESRDRIGYFIIGKEVIVV